MVQRAYRHDLRCPHCGDCLYKFTPGGNRGHYSEAVKSQAVEMYCEGSAIAAISRVLGVKSGTVSSWIKKSPAVVGCGDDGAYAAC